MFFQVSKTILSHEHIKQVVLDSVKVSKCHRIELLSAKKNNDYKDEQVHKEGQKPFTY